MNATKTAHIPEPSCEERTCFANKNGNCIVLINNDFHGKHCPFFKTEERLEKERRECARRKNKRPGAGSHTGAASIPDDDDFLARARAAIVKVRESHDDEDTDDGDDWCDEEDFDDDRTDD